MKQVLQSLKDGSTLLADVPVPKIRKNHLLIRTTTTAISSGTERMLVKFGKSGWISKARQQPEKVKQVLEKARTDGLVATLDAVRSKLDQPLELGYCNVGYVECVGDGVTGFGLGDRVVSNGSHAEYVLVPKNLCAKIPESISSDAASFTILGAIGLQGIRLLEPKLGECVVVFGLGVIGLLTVQMLIAQGCRVVAVDFDSDRLMLAEQFGAKAVVATSEKNILDAVQSASRGYGADGAIITASTESDQPIRMAAHVSRKRGRIVLVGVAGLHLNRADFYEKELSFQVSCSYGPGRYDASYEENGNDYPIGYVRWTEQRNFEAVLDMMAAGAIDVSQLISHRYKIDDVASAMDLLNSTHKSLGILLDFPDGGEERATAKVKLRCEDQGFDGRRRASGNAVVAFLGAGNYAGRVLMPAFSKAGAVLNTVVSAGGVSAVHFGKKFGFQEAATDADTAIKDPKVDTVVIGTRHDLHARQVLLALQAGKHVFCEKPLCLTLDELKLLESEIRSRPQQLVMVGFNRRFSPQVAKIKQLLDSIEGPKSFIITVNAGEIPGDHWVQSRSIGGRRIIGEGCHFIDLLRHLAGAPIREWHAVALGGCAARETEDDKVIITLKFKDGSIGVINYFANGHKALEKERLEVFAGGRVFMLKNFIQLKAYGCKGFGGSRLWKQNKGNSECVSHFVQAIREKGEAPIAVEEILEVSRVSIEIADSLV
ncbi:MULTISPECIES: bi-domain-containing oxidoreductase [Kordiimonas]|jgi:predicted dehydrogenase/threonine dehydrogenase-like Zn-dependent dehydrogenase|uniref:bi-domain-containing oxidoreductase n=1 Tax=Kordiimonas TaxID=288021 RepID=UPI00257BF218|nr:bi-domain-containing oxidoreductase [Kordiimonas sp. UBA4487]